MNTRPKNPCVRIAILFTVTGLLVSNAPLCLAVVDPISPTADVSLAGVSTTNAQWMYQRLSTSFSRTTDNCVGCFQGLYIQTQYVYASRSAYTASSWWVSGTFNSRQLLKPFRNEAGQYQADFRTASSVYVEYLNGTLRIRFTDGLTDRDLRYGISKTRLIGFSYTSMRSGLFNFSSTPGQSTPVTFSFDGSFSSSGSTTRESVNVAGLAYRDRRSITISNSPFIVTMIHQWDSDTGIDAQVTAWDVTHTRVASGTIHIKFPDGHPEPNTDITGQTLTTNAFLAHAKAISDQAWMSSAIYLSPVYPTRRAYHNGHVVFQLDVASTPLQELISRNFDYYK